MVIPRPTKHKRNHTGFLKGLMSLFLLTYSYINKHCCIDLFLECMSDKVKRL